MPVAYWWRPPWARKRLGGAPLLVGITGKRDLGSGEDAVRRTLRAAFDRLDKELPDTPKIVLSGLAVGADTIAAELALERVGWEVFAVLPFAQKAYETDFGDPAELAHLRDLVRRPGVRLYEMRPLQRRGGNETDRYTIDELMRGPGAPPDRTLHYEQAGIYIAERCALMIGVVGPDEQPDRLGGSARILQWRLHEPDAQADNVRERSLDLLSDGWLENRCRGPVWRILLDPEIAAADGLLPVRVQNPDRHHVNAWSDDSWAYNLATRTSLDVGRRLDLFNRRARLFRPRTEPLRAGARAPRSLTTPAPDAAERLRLLRGVLADVSNQMKQRVTASVWLIALLFVAAVTALEVHVELGVYPWAEPMGAAYPFLGLAAVGVFLLAGVRRWQAMAQDYRAVAEALRAQIVLWDCGLQTAERREDLRHLRVDLQYLRGAKGTLAMVRAAVGQLVEGARLQRPMADPNPGEPAHWIRGQIAFFEPKITKRRRWVVWAQTLSWQLFLAGLAMAFCAALMQMDDVAHSLEPVRDLPDQLLWTGLAGGGGALAGMLSLSRALRQAAGKTREPRLRGFQRVAGAVLGLLSGLVAAAGALASASLMPSPAGPSQPVSPELWEHLAEALMLLVAVFFATTAGAIRFVSEKLSWEAELDGYEHTNDYFVRAEKALGNFDAGTAERRRELIRELVGEALKESEAWLSAHRERPLEPVVGG